MALPWVHTVQGLLVCCWICATSSQTFDYLIYPTSGTVRQAEAKAYCRNTFGGDLASITSRAEAQYLKTFIASNFPGSDAWIGTERLGTGANDASWRWSDGSTFISILAGENLWAAGEPNNYRGREYCGALRADGSGVNDADCRRRNKAICKRVSRHTASPTSAPPTPAPTSANPYLAANWVQRVDSQCYYKYYNRVVNKTLTSIRRKTWREAQSFCQTEAGFRSNLVDISDSAENDFVRDLITIKYRDFGNRPVWIGGVRIPSSVPTDNTFQWVGSNTQITNYFWADGEPTNAYQYQNLELTENCLQMNHAKHDIPGQWNDADCNKLRGWICKVCDGSL